MTDPNLSRAEAQRKFAAVWAQTTIPVVFRSGASGHLPLEVRIPHRNRRLVHWWLLMGRRTRVVYDAARGSWRVPKVWLKRRYGWPSIVDRLLYEFDAVYVIQPYRKMEKCAPACRNAKGHDCECSCLGVNHGGDHRHGAHWFDVHEAFSFRFERSVLACRLLRTVEHRGPEL